MINIRINETNEVKTLSIIDENGVDWVQDLLCNAGALQNYDEETEEYRMSNEDYEWWVQYIENYTADEQEIMELAEELEIDIYDIKERIGHNMNCDMEDEHAIKQRVLQEIKEEHGIIYNQGRKRSL